MEALRKDLAGLQAEIVGQRERLKAVLRRVDEQKELADAVHKLALTIQGMLHQLEMARRDIDEIKSKSARRWETVVLEVLRMAVAVGVGAVLMRLGLQ